MLFRTFVFVALAATVAASQTPRQQCRVTTYSERINRGEVTEFQKWINEGHEPWRIDEADAVASVYLIDFAKKHNELPSPVTHPHKELKHSERLAAYEFESVSESVTFRVALTKFSWLLPTARKWDHMAWFVTEVRVIEHPKACQEAK